MKVCSKIILVLIVLACVTPRALAQDFYRNVNGAGSVAMGGIYVPSSHDATDALSANPAGLTRLSGRTLNANLTAVFARGSFANSANSSAPLATSPGVLPYGAFGMPIDKCRFSFGVGFMPELLSVADWNYVDAPGVAGATYGMQQHKSAILAGRAGAGMGMVVNPRLSLGASFGVVYNSNTLHAPYIFQSEPTLSGLKTLLDLRTNGTGWNANVGMLAKPSRTVEIGASWKSRTVVVSNGDASGDAYAQFAALGLAGVPSDFHYSAQVRNVLPQSALASIAWHASPRWMVAFQTNWVNWKNAFVTLPVTLTDGTNPAINGLVGSTTLVDGVPLNWRDQYSFHVGAERGLTESTAVRFGYSYANNPVPSSTVMPLTAAIMSNQISGGLNYHVGPSTLEAAYTFVPMSRSDVAQSSLLSGEYNNSTVRVGTQSVTLNYSLRF